MAGNKGRGKVMSTQQQTQDQSVIKTGDRHAHTRGITMSTRLGKGKGVGKRPRCDNYSGQVESNSDSPINMNTSSASRQTPTSDSHGDSSSHDNEVELSEHDSDTNTDPPPSSSGSVHRKKDSWGRFIGSSTSAGVRKNNKDDSWVLKESMPDIRLLKSYGGHVAVEIWHGQSRGVLSGANRGSHCRKLAQLVAYHTCLPCT